MGLAEGEIASTFVGASFFLTAEALYKKVYR